MQILIHAVLVSPFILSGNVNSPSLIAEICVLLWKDTCKATVHRVCILELFCQMFPSCLFNTLRPGQNGRHFADDILKRIFLNENILIPIKISLKFVPEGSINNIPSLVQIMAWRRRGDKPLSETMMVDLPTHICVTRPQWVKKDVTQNIFIQA